MKPVLTFYLLADLRSVVPVNLLSLVFPRMSRWGYFIKWEWYALRGCEKTAPPLLWYEGLGLSDWLFSTLPNGGSCLLAVVENHSACIQIWIGPYWESFWVNSNLSRHLLRIISDSRHWQSLSINWAKSLITFNFHHWWKLRLAQVIDSSTNHQWWKLPAICRVVTAHPRGFAEGTLLSQPKV